MLKKIPRICVDFNEMLEPDLVLLTKNDTKTDSSGAVITLYEGMDVAIYSEDGNADKLRDDLIAEGKVERNLAPEPWAKVAKWCCRIDRNGVRYESEAH
ncbi:hypothetical protein [Massilia aquatica]|uniref:Uncharacterized protein n=1 Tax=Massilia aquatica TaxID=2609000 RepID=A0ABX0M6Z7_9BURK|nr:hypothetical protein [Massilia aquatica]NHZ42959.1 hypothetical protein [Massilia aquatica]